MSLAQLLPESVDNGVLRVAQVAGRSTLLNARASDPVKYLIPQQRGEAVWAYTTTYGGGLVSGDHIQLSIHAEEQARLFIGTQASTKVYKRKALNQEVHQDIDFYCGADSLVISLPDPLVCFAGAQFRQQQRFYCHPSSSVFALDCFTAGRIARDERWAFASLISHMRFFIDDVCVVDDPMFLQNLTHTSIADRMGLYNIFGSVIITGEAFADLRRKLQQRIINSSSSDRASLDKACIESISPISHGCIWRFAAYDIASMFEHILTSVDTCKAFMGGAPWRRRA